MSSFSTPFLLSIEPVDGKTFRGDFHLGTDLAVAKALVAERFHGRNEAGMATRTTAVLDAKGRVVDVYDGEWASERG